MWCWPLHQQPPLLPDAPGLFGAHRRYDRHTGVDLYADRGTTVVAVESGVVVLVEGFTGPSAPDPTPWWHDTEVVLVEGPSGVVVYGELAASVQKGQVVAAESIIGRIKTSLLRVFKGRPMTMLHLELMRPGSQNPVWWRSTETQPSVLLDPTPQLVEAAGSQLIHFSMEMYDNKRFR